MRDDEIEAAIERLRADVETVPSVSRPDFNYGVNTAAAFAQEYFLLSCGDECVGRLADAIPKLALPPKAHP